MKLSLSPRVDAKPYGSVLLRLVSHGVQYIHMEIFNRIEYLPHHAPKGLASIPTARSRGFYARHDKEQQYAGETGML